MFSAERKEKIKWLQCLQRGEISPDQLPEQKKAVFNWQFDGIEYLQVNSRDDEPHKSGRKLTLEAFAIFVNNDRTRTHIIWDTATIKYGDIQVETLVYAETDEKRTTEPTMKEEEEPQIIRISVKPPECKGLIPPKGLEMLRFRKH